MGEHYKVRITRHAYSQMKEIRQYIEEEPWRIEGIRRLIVKNFYIYYWTDEQEKTVHVTTVVYGKRDQIRQLSQMDKI